MVEPDYYASNGLSPLKAYEKGLLSHDEYVGFLKGNVIKYTVRAGKKDKDPLMDIFKAIDYLHHLHRALKEDDDVSDNGLNSIEGLFDEEDVVGCDGEIKESYEPKTSLRPKPNKNLRHIEPLVDNNGDVSLGYKFRKMISGL